MSTRVNLVSAQELPELRAALEHYRFESVNQFLRASCRTLIEHYHKRDQLLAPLKFHVYGEHIYGKDTALQSAQ